jgi:hypothetical protein
MSWMRSYSWPSTVDQAVPPRGRFATQLGSMTTCVGGGSVERNLTLAAAVRRARRRSEAILWSNLVGDEEAHDFR